MINQVYRLVAPRRFEIAYTECSLQSSGVIVRPQYLSICAADQRYYTGSRAKEVLQQKLPMALIHEAMGIVVHDPQGHWAHGTRVVLIPNHPTESDDVVAENYLRSSKFCSSSRDGFMQDYVVVARDRLVEVPSCVSPTVAAFTELVSVSTHAIDRFAARAHERRDVFGVWGDGNLGFIVALLLKKQYPRSQVYVFGKTEHKLAHFSFADGTYLIDAIPRDLTVHHAFECTGGMGSQVAIAQIIDRIEPEGTISLLGVSELPVEVNTRMVLEKGLTLFGSSRSGRADFLRAVEILQTQADVPQYLQTLVGTVCDVHSIQDMVTAFETDLTTSWGKTVMAWNV